MSTEAATTSNSTATDGIATGFSLIFELEGAAINGRETLFQAAKSVFDKSNVNICERDLARFCTHGAIPQIIQKLVDEVGTDKMPDDASEKILQAYHQQIKTGSLSVHPLFTELLKEASSRGIIATAMTILPEELAEDVLKRTGLSAQGVGLFAFEEAERHFPRLDCWMKVCRQVAKSPRACIAVAGCRDSGKSALSSGMRCIIIPDQFTSYQDFSGVDAVLESAEELDLKTLLNHLT